VTGYTKNGWKCQDNNYCGFKLVLNANASDVLNNIDTVCSRLAAFTKTTSTDCSAVTFTSIQSGSTVVDGTITGASAADVSAGLGSGSSIGGYTITSSSVTGYGTAA
jgi:hypothetical protein